MDSECCFSLNLFRAKGRSHRCKKKGPSPGIPEAICRRFSLSEIEKATQGFHPDKVIGHGRFSSVYKGCLDDDQVAIKRLDRRTLDKSRSEFWKEAELCSQLRHPNLVAFKGFCFDHDEMINVFEYMPNCSLGHRLFGKASETLPWRRRLGICIDIARGLHYLHSGVKQTIIHRNVTAHTILLGQNWVARLSDLGLSKVSKALTRVDSVKGTFGYIEPEYMATGKLTEKTDVYAFGVVLFEVLSGRRVVEPSSDESYSIGWVLECQQNGTLHEMVDPCVKEQIAPKCLPRFLDIAERCLHKDRTQRPAIGEIQVALEDALDLQDGRPADSI